MHNLYFIACDRCNGRKVIFKIKINQKLFEEKYGQDLLFNISILNIERNLTKQVDLEKIISTFADLKTRKKFS